MLDVSVWTFPATHSSDCDQPLSHVTLADSPELVTRRSHWLGRSLLLNQHDVSQWQLRLHSTYIHVNTHTHTHMYTLSSCTGTGSPSICLPCLCCCWFSVPPCTSLLHGISENEHLQILTGADFTSTPNGMHGFTRLHRTLIFHRNDLVGRRVVLLLMKPLSVHQGPIIIHQLGKTLHFQVPTIIQSTPHTTQLISRCCSSSDVSTARPTWELGPHTWQSSVINSQE